MHRGNRTLADVTCLSSLAATCPDSVWAVRSAVCPSVRPQEDVYRATTQHLVEGVISGYNATVFAYGPSGTAQGSILQRGLGGRSMLSLTTQSACRTPLSLTPSVLGGAPRGGAISFPHSARQS